jgi:hypothetical protein
VRFMSFMLLPFYFAAIRASRGTEDALAGPNTSGPATIA